MADAAAAAAAADPAPEPEPEPEPAPAPARDTHEQRRARVEAEETKSGVFETRLKDAERLRGIGNERFRDGDTGGALDAYERALFHCEFDELSFDYELMDEHRTAVRAVMLPTLLNLAATLLRAGPAHDPAQAAEHCSEVLKHDEDSVKALFRRAQARRALGDAERAREDLRRAVQLAPNDKSIRGLLADVREDLKLEREKTKKLEREAFGGWAGGSSAAAGGGSAPSAGGGAADVEAAPESPPAAKQPYGRIFWALALAVGLLLLYRRLARE